LTPLEARVLGVLVEKQHTVPDTYPLSLNALVAGCNQKTARSPVIEATEAEVLTAVDGLKAASLLFEVSGSRVARYEHNMTRRLGLPSQSMALLAVLMLRGPQTSAELRLNCERLHRFADISSVDAFLVELAEKDPPRTVRLARAPGSRESRWAHLLCGDAGLQAAPEGPLGATDAASGGVAASEVAALKAELARAQDRIDALEAGVDRLFTELGLSR
jgi:uncharacterized protein YceH (UPF0502 family)